MSSSNVDIAQTVTICGKILHNYDFVYPIQIGFEVDEILLKYVSIHDVDYDNAPFMIKINTNLIRGNTLFCFPSGSEFFHENVNIPFQPSSSFINGNYIFSIREEDDSLPASLTSQMYIGIALVFIQYKKDKNLVVQSKNSIF